MIRTMRTMITFLFSLAITGCTFINPSIVSELQSTPITPRAERLLVLALPDRELPLRYLQQGDCLYLGAGGTWWRQLQTPLSVQVWLRGHPQTAIAQAFPGASAVRKPVMRQLRDRWPASWLRVIRKGQLVLVDLQHQASQPERCLAEFKPA